jgi:hypothetical protein
MSTSGQVPGRWTVVVFFLLAVAVIAPTVGDFGLTYDEPAYRYSQLVSIQWWQRLVRARSGSDLSDLFTADALLYYWPYARHGINFHPPLAGQGNLLTYGIFGGVLKDIPARRMASAIELALTATLIFAFIGRRYGAWAGAAAGAALILMPRVYGQAHLIDTDTPGMLLWVAGAFAFWKGLKEPDGWRWRVAVGIVSGLAFVEKMAAVLFLLPIFAWLMFGHLLPALRRPRIRDWLNADLMTIALMGMPLIVAFLEIRRLAKLLPPPQFADLFYHRPPSRLAGVVLLAPLGIWLLRRGLERAFTRGGTRLPERPALETVGAILAFGPAVSLVGNPACWRETFVRLAHYYTLNTAREGALPDIRILYLGQTYTFSLPPSNGWVLMAITVPATILVAAGIGLIFALRRMWKGDALPAFIVLNLVTIPLLRMLPTPAHDGVRLMLPAFAFLAILAGWGIAWVGDGLIRLAGVDRGGATFDGSTADLATPHPNPPPQGGRRPEGRGRTTVTVAHLIVAMAFLALAGWQLVRIHPFELSYYNELIGGPRGAWRRGFELSYWYDAFTPAAIRELNEGLPRGAQITFLDDLSSPVMVGQDLQSLGALRSDLVLGLGNPRQFPFVWLLTHDSKAVPVTRLLYQMTPWLAVQPRQLDGIRVATVADPVAVSRAWALQLLAEGDVQPRRPDDPTNRVPPPTADAAIIQWAKRDPGGLMTAARAVASGKPLDDPEARALKAHMERRRRDGRDADRTISSRRLAVLLGNRPEALVEAAKMLIDHPEQVRAALECESFADPRALGGYLDRDLAPP